MGNIVIIISVFVLIIIIFIIFIVIKCANRCSFSNNEQYVKINKELDNEHSDIINACDNLYNICKKHWDTEDRLYNKGRQKMPKTHKNIESDWESHKLDHTHNLEKIKNLKAEIIKHINTKDQAHFSHWINKI